MSETLASPLSWRDQLWLHTAANLRFYRRNRLLLILVLITAGILSLPILPSLFESTTKRFDLMRTMQGQMDWLIWITAAGLGLFAVSAHLRDKSAKMIFTRPGRPDVWLLSIFVSAFMVAVVAEVVAASLTLVLSIAFGVPYQIGFLFLTLKTLAQTLIVMAFLTTLGITVHPVIAVLFVAFFNERSLYGLEYLMNMAQETWANSWWPAPARWTVHGLRCVLPTLTPFMGEMENVERSLRVSGREWQYLAAACGYALLVSTFLYFLSAWSLRRRSLV